MKNKSVIALMLAFTMSFTSVCPALAAENTAVESEEVTESEPEEVSEENAVHAEETAPEEQIVSGADEEVTNASSGNQTEPVETTEVTEDTEEITDESANATEETENVTDEAADAAEESKDGTDETTGVAVVDGTTEEYSKKAGEAAAEPEFTGTITITVEGQTAVPDNSGDESPEDLFEQYMSVEFGLSGKSSMRKAQKATGTRLEGNDLAVYQAVARELPAIAAGERASTEIELTPEDFGYDKLEWTAEELGVDAIIENGAFSPAALEAAQKKVYFDLDKVDNALLADFPYELYWFDKTKGVETSDINYSGNSNTISITGNIVVKYSVAGEFAAGEYTVKTDIGQSVQAAVDNVNAILGEYSGASDEGKLQGYKDAICARVSYNDDAAGGGVAYGNPWQLLWVFDNDDETKVVCEGYSKAFKYLCDNTSFDDDDITCILVTGTMDGGTGAGPHMWNIVKKGDGKNYLVDVTNCDGNSVGAPNQLFMTREADLITDNGKETGYTFHLDSGNITYTYDEDTLNYYEQDEISLSELQHEHTLVETPAKAATCTEEGNIQYWTCSECGKIFSDEAGETEINLEDTVVPVKAHTLTHVDANAATCTDTGNKEHWKCSVCGALFSDEEGTTPTTAEAVEIAATGHTLTYVKAMDATCTDTGNKEHWKCSVCGALFSDEEGTKPTTAEAVEIVATGHNLTETEAKAATCTEAGNIEYWTCGTCGKLFKDSEGTQEINQEETVVVAGHDLSKTEAKAATCTEAGNIEYWTCGICKKLFSDAEGTTEIEEKDTVVPATGHAWGEWTEVKPATEEEEGLQTRTCSNDESHKEERTVHSLEKTEAKDATCTEAGNTEYWKCSRCRKYFSDAEGTTEIEEKDTVVAAKGHTLTETEAKAATCTEAGNIAYWTCGTCKKLFSDAEGTTEITIADTVVAAKGHSLEKTEAKDATCTEAGNTEYWTCSECKKLFGDDKGTTEITEEATVVAVKGHALEKTEAKAATCTEAGNTEYWTCSECKKLFGDDKGTTEITVEDTVVAAKGHALEKTEAKAATCTEAGNTEYWTCSECKKLFSDDKGTTEITAEDTVVAAKGHSLEKTDAKDATCTEAGNTEYWTCSECKKLFGDDQGTREITAADTVVAATGHNWGEWTVVKAATEEEEGLERRTCSNDESHTEEKTIPKLNHVHNLEKTEAVDATCTEAGNIEYWTCSKCNKLYKDSEGTQEITEADTVVAARGHSLEKTEAKDATCTEAGNTEYWTCSVCKKLFGDDQGTTEITAADTVVAAKGHSLEKTEAVDATCTEAGNIEYWTCSECKKLFGDDQGTTEITAADTVVAAKGHSLEKTEAKDATCTEAGNTEYWTCSECKKLFGDDQGTTEITAADTVVAAKGHSLEKTEAKDATCTEAGNTEYWTCSKCNKLYKDSEGTQEITEADTAVAAKGHNWTEWTVVTKATEEKEGLETRTCLNDESHKEERTIPKLQGKWKKNNKGWWYVRGDGSYPAGEFETIKGKTYYFNESGYMLTGWQKISGEWYYFSAGGAMLTDWQKINDKWYYFSASGAMQTDWQNINGTWYYFSAGGAMQTGWQKINGTWYYFSAGGAMQTGWQKIDGKWYYFGAGGAMLTGWQQINGTWYYMEASGAMAANKWVGDYYLTGSGAMAKNTWIGNYYVGADGKWIPGYKK